MDDRAIQIKKITPSDALWNQVSDYAKNCSWRAGSSLAEAMDYLRSLGFDSVYLVSDHENLYEKYGFEVIDHKTAPWGSVEKIYRQGLNQHSSRNT